VNEVYVEYMAQMRYALSESQRAFLKMQKEKILKIAIELTFSRVEGDEDEIILSLKKMGPMLTYQIVFYNDFILCTGITNELTNLRHFDEIIRRELSMLIGKTESNLQRIEYST
jgi:hypothetical protein